MTDRENAIENIMNFLEDKEKRILLIRGYDNKAKIRASLSCLNRVFSKGIIRTGLMSDISDHINCAFNRDILPHQVKSTTSYKIGKMNVRINSYVNHTQSNPKGNENTFTLFLPVENVLKKDSRYNDFIDDLNNSGSAKVILITTNEWGINNWDIEAHVDEVFFYKVENDNPQLMSNLRNNGAL